MHSGAGSVWVFILIAFFVITGVVVLTVSVLFLRFLTGLGFKQAAIAGIVGVVLMVAGAIVGVIIFGTENTVIIEQPAFWVSVGSWVLGTGVCAYLIKKRRSASETGPATQDPPD